MAKKKPSGDDGGGANWMDTYGDLVTLLLTFFVLLFASSNLDAAKWQEIAASLSGNPIAVVPVLSLDGAKASPIQVMPSAFRESSSSAADTERIRATVERNDENYRRLVASINEFVDDKGLQELIEMVEEYDKYQVVVHLNETVLFNSGSAELLPDAFPMLDTFTNFIANNLAAIEIVRIEGHTDNVPIHTMEFTDNWDLSCKRAANTLRYIQSTELIPGHRLQAGGYGEMAPVATNETAEGRQKNRRVDFVIEAQTEAIR